MDIPIESSLDGDINQVIAAAAGVAAKKADAKTSAKDAFVRFIEQFYRGSPPDDLKTRSAEALYRAAAGAWEALQQRKPGAAKIVVNNDSAERTTLVIVNDDMPFLVSSITCELERMETSPRLVIHPVLAVERDEAGKLIALLDAPRASVDGEANPDTTESLIYVEIARETDDAQIDRLRDNLIAVLNDVRAAVRDWAAMRRETLRIAADFDDILTGVKPARSREVMNFLQWLHDDHFTFLGYRYFRLEGAGKARKFHIDREKSLGVLTKARLMIFEGVSDGAPVPPQFADFLDSRNMLLILKANQRSTVQRRAHYDVVSVKIPDESGKIVGMHMLVGLFTADVYTNSPSFVPVLRNKLERIRARVGFPKHSHDDKVLQNVMENLPRDELFETSDTQLMATAVGILHLQQRPRTAVFMRPDPFERFASILVYVPRDRFDTALRLAIGDILVKAFDGRISSYYTQVTDSPLARIHYIIATKPGRVPKVDAKEVEARIVKVARAWTDDLRAALAAARGEREGARLFELFAHAFPSAYRERFDAETGIGDIDRILSGLESKKVGIHVYQPPGATGGTTHIKIYNFGSPLPLSDVMPVLEHMGFKVIGEEPFQITPLGSTSMGGPIWLHDFDVAVSTAVPIDIFGARHEIQEAFRRVWSGEMESDGFNKLVALADLGWRKVVILRTYAKYLRQAAFPFSQAYIENAFAAHPHIARLLVEMFLTAFDPALHKGAKAKATDARVKALNDEVLSALDAVSNADEDRILRRYLNLLGCTLRTNYFQKSADGGHKSYVSIKLDSRKIEDLPLPRPMVEVFVYSPRVEAIHLRGGKVARGGIRWSDRREDFRSEILGLVKAQMVKNAVIVPTGSKGGFVVKNPPPVNNREAFQAEGIACYKTLQRGLLDITDNVVHDKIVPPVDVVRKDGDDPYLVVAADKGTATFSDIANAVSAKYGFWLGDAYASGGSAGYDHKAMGITARGAWESVKRHFREMGVDTQAQDFTCVGVGDMSGDVFGNGMLMSKHIRLLAAFNHMHIFIDPDPDAAASYAERERLFKMPRSSWTDYNAKLISKGGGVFARSAKTIKLSAEIKALLALNGAEATPAEIMNAMLKANVDLLFFGGIGSYVKSSHENHADAMDRANDAIRIDGDQLRAKVIGEGANLGMTQRGRIEAAQHGVRLNTDAIDNSAGVDCSDHEVNIKILLNGQMNAGKLTLAARNKLLVDMTDEVAQLVLRDNYQQTQTISMLEQRGVQFLDAQVRMMRVLEREGLLNRELEFLPSDEDVQDRFKANQGLTRPELSVFLSYGKMWLYDKVVASDLPDDPLAEDDLHAYFPVPLQKKYRAAIEKHKLRREIIATVITNSLVNRVGPSFVTVLMEQTGMSPVDVARAYTVTRAAYGLREIWNEIEALDNQVPARVQGEMLFEVMRMMGRSVLWMLRHIPAPMDMAATIKQLKPDVEVIRKAWSLLCTDEVAAYVKRQADAYRAKGVPEKLANAVACIYRLAASNDISLIAATTQQPIQTVAKLYFLVGERFGLGALRARTETFARVSHWDRLAVSAAIEELFAHQTTITQCVMELGKAKKLTGEKALAAWTETNKGRIDRYDQVFAEVKSADALSLSMLTVANRQLSAMTATA